MSRRNVAGRIRNAERERELPPTTIETIEMRIDASDKKLRRVFQICLNKIRKQVSKDRGTVPIRSMRHLFVDVVLKVMNQTQLKTVYMKIRKSDLYLVAFRKEERGRLYVLKEEGNGPSFNNSTLLPYTGHYLALLSGDPFSNFHVGFYSLINAAVELIEVPESQPNNWKKPLALMAVTFCESARFNHVFYLVNRLIVNRRDQVLEPWAPQMFHNWRTMSKDVLALPNHLVAPTRLTKQQLLSFAFLNDPLLAKVCLNVFHYPLNPEQA